MKTQYHIIEVLGKIDINFWCKFHIRRGVEAEISMSLGRTATRADFSFRFASKICSTLFETIILILVQSSNTSY